MESGLLMQPSKNLGMTKVFQIATETSSARALNRTEPRSVSLVIYYRCESRFYCERGCESSPHKGMTMATHQVEMYLEEYTNLLDDHLVV